MSEYNPDQETTKLVQPATCSSALTEVEKLIKQHPATAMLSAVAIGYAVGVLSRVLLTPPPPPPPKQRALRVLEDIQSRLADLVQPTYNKAHTYAEDGADAVRKSLQQFQDLPVGKRLKSLFS
jgi:hypothetical protein